MSLYRAPLAGMDRLRVTRENGHILIARWGWILRLEVGRS